MIPSFCCWTAPPLSLGLPFEEPHRICTWTREHAHRKRLWDRTLWEIPPDWISLLLHLRSTTVKNTTMWFLMSIIKAFKHIHKICNNVSFKVLINVKARVVRYDLIWGSVTLYMYTLYRTKFLYMNLIFLNSHICSETLLFTSNKKPSKVLFTIQLLQHEVKLLGRRKRGLLLWAITIHHAFYTLIMPFLVFAFKRDYATVTPLQVLVIHGTMVHLTSCQARKVTFLYTSKATFHI